jgi:hypothetical protein
MQHVLTTSNRLRPAIIGAQIRRQHLEPLTDLNLGPHPSPHFLLLGQVANRSPHPIAATQQLDHASPPKKPRAAGDQDRLHQQAPYSRDYSSSLTLKPTGRFGCGGEAIS